jgi:hypothetical protein
VPALVNELASDALRGRCDSALALVHHLLYRGPLLPAGRSRAGSEPRAPARSPRPPGACAATATSPRRDSGRAMSDALMTASLAAT